MTVTRRTVTKGIAWSVPTLLVAATVPAVAASTCVPQVSLDVAQSFKCCGGGPNKSMKIVLAFSNVETQCVPATPLCVTGVTLGNGQVPGQVILPDPPCIDDLSQEMTVYLLDVQSCPSTVYLEITVAGFPPVEVPLSLQSLSDGSDDSCGTLLDLIVG